MIDFFIKHILAKLCKLTAAQWLEALAVVKELAFTALAGSEKAVKFNAWLAKVASNLDMSGVEMVRNLAIRYLRYKGVIPPANT